MSIEKETESASPKNKPTETKSEDWKKEHNQQKFYYSTTFKGIKVGYTGDLMDDENIPF
ncbi:hypothetical protein ACQKDB_15920 [Planococcus kocurii]|uniref:hypothetical protein n=1 Tax=Planococcus kocurii TaxID=1374 RepID=UPI003D0821D7